MTKTIKKWKGSKSLSCSLRRPCDYKTDLQPLPSYPIHSNSGISIIKLMKVDSIRPRLSDHKLEVSSIWISVFAHLTQETEIHSADSSNIAVVIQGTRSWIRIIEEKPWHCGHYTSGRVALGIEQFLRYRQTQKHIPWQQRAKQPKGIQLDYKKNASTQWNVVRDE